MTLRQISFELYSGMVRQSLQCWSLQSSWVSTGVKGGTVCGVNGWGLTGCGGGEEEEEEGQDGEWEGSGHFLFGFFGLVLLFLLENAFF